MLGIGLYGLTYIYPVYLAQIRGYNALMIGETMFVSGLAMFATAPIAGRLMNRVDPRLMLMAGFLFFTGTLFPALGFLNVHPFRYSYVADHFQYLAILGIIVPAACGQQCVLVNARKIPQRDPGAARERPGVNEELQLCGEGVRAVGPAQRREVVDANERTLVVLVPPAR